VLEDARTNAGDKEDPELLQEGVAVQGPGQHLLRGDEDASRVSGGGETAEEFYLIDAKKFKQDFVSSIQKSCFMELTHCRGET